MAVDRNSRPVLTDCAGSRYRVRIGEGEAFPSATASLPIFRRATMPQVPSPDTREGLGGGVFSVCHPTWCAIWPSGLQCITGPKRLVITYFRERRLRGVIRAWSLQRFGAFPVKLMPIPEGIGKRYSTSEG
jgi:hypothetical protein